MSFETIRYAQEDRIIRITLDRPDKHNALNPQMLEELDAAFARADADDQAGVVVLRGAGERAFCAGADLGGMASDDLRFLELHEARGRFPRLFLRMLRHSKPILAAVNGHCIAGGLGLMLACDLAIAKRGGKLGTPEVKRGLFPFMISALMTRLLGGRAANELMLLGELYSADQAKELGLVNRVEAPEDFDPAVEAWATEMAAASPAVFRLGKQALFQQQHMSLEAAFSHLQAMISINATLEDAQEGVAAFFERRDPVFKGR